ncbi:DUF58 domain-containing protein [Nocardioides marmoriginsengisoli]|uniref:DUF58 domain-containing protein n=1 Tax=Nocardioides marmoriginsengisoli TaxID=661483 RepID=A0A3N0CNW2_9ACTN|nr:DUF58 domain-containing protein [Nocardioides marmoriginsengisoli]RNL65009.1 DUF58 domain-containing protein [Nocardioides marmoriginsengisoli]
MDGFRTGLRALTTRGRAFIAGGVTAVVCGLVLGERDIVRIGALIGLLPLLTVAFVARTGQHLSLNRSLSPTQVEVDQTATVRLDLTNHGARTGLLLVEDQVPWALGHRPRFVVDAIPYGWHREVEFPVRAEVRGTYDIGPVQLRVADPFGMLSLHRSFTQVSTLVVVPAAEPLPSIRLSGAWTGSGENRPRPFSSGGTADVTVREYRIGDDLRRVHWRSTARTGELMVRREEQPWQSRCTLFVDNRGVAHRGSGPDSSLERAITAIASIAVHLAHSGFQVRLISADGEADLDEFREHGWHDSDAVAQVRPVLERLAALPTTGAVQLPDSWVTETGSTGLFIGVFGALSQHDRALLGRLQNHGAASYAMALDVETWAARTRDPAEPAGPAAPATSSTSWLQHHGWKATDLTRSGSLPVAWQELGR